MSSARATTTSSGSRARAARARRSRRRSGRRSRASWPQRSPRRRSRPCVSPASPTATGCAKRSGRSRTVSFPCGRWIRRSPLGSSIRPTSGLRSKISSSASASCDTSLKRSEAEMVREAPLEQTEAGLVPQGEGWFVVNAKEARWLEHKAFGSGTTFEGKPEFAQIGINIGVLEPGQPACLYHREDAQEDFLVLFGECLLLVEGEERPLKPWDFVHCPPWTEHVFVAPATGPVRSSLSALAGVR